MRNITSVLLVGLILVPSQLFAQSTPNPIASTAPASISIRESAERQAAAIATQSVRVSLPMDSKRSWMSRHSTAAGTLIGFGVGAGFGAARCGVWATCDVSPARAAITSGIVTAGIGAMIGMANSFRPDR
jgi:hypothetical protein